MKSDNEVLVVPCGDGGYDDGNDDSYGVVVILITEVVTMMMVR